VKYEWDDEKEEKNRKKHKVSFEEAIEVFEDEERVERFDLEHSSKKEERWQIIGQTRKGKILFVVYVEIVSRRIRLISARRAEVSEEAIYFRSRKRR
jgi:hypothetical protein